MARLLTEYMQITYDEQLREKARECSEKGLPLTMKALLQRADVPNANKRIYPRSILEREVKGYQEAIAEGRSGGQLDHPDKSVVELQYVSHSIKDIWWSGNEVWGTVEIHPKLPKGKDALGLVEAGIRLGISSRAVGETTRNEDDYDVVGEDLYLICWDLVSEPSTKNAWLMKEGRELSQEEIRKIIPKKDRVNRIIEKILRNED